MLSTIFTSINQKKKSKFSKSRNACIRSEVLPLVVFPARQDRRLQKHRCHRYPRRIRPRLQLKIKKKNSILIYTTI